MAAAHMQLGNKWADISKVAESIIYIWNIWMILVVLYSILAAPAIICMTLKQ